MGPIATGLGEIFQFEVRSKPGFGHSLMALHEVLEWQIAYQLRGVPGVIEVNTNGGEARAYEVVIDPDKLQAFGVAINRVTAALRENNANEGGGYLTFSGAEQRIVRGQGRIASHADLGGIVLDSRDGTPVFLRQVAEVRDAPVLRQGASTRDGRGEVVVGIVMLLAGENPSEVVERVKAKLAEIEKSLPEGVTVEPFYDRTALVRLTVTTLTHNLLEGGVLVVVVLLVLLGSVRAGLVVALAVPLSMAGAFVGMLYAGLSGNLMSLGAIDFGLIVDGSVVMIENVVRRVAERRHSAGEKVAPVEVVRDACAEVARPVVFGVGIILLVYLPILSLRGIEGKMFRPMALTVIFALVTSLALALLLMPVLAAVFLRSASEREPLLVRWAKAAYAPALRLAMAAPAAVALAAGLAFALSVVGALRLGGEFIPTLDEGSVALQVTRLPSVSLETSVQMAGQLERSLKKVP